MSTAQNKIESQNDLSFKREVMKYLWYLGYIPRRNVLLLEQWQGGSQYTDIDVLGIKIDEELGSDFIVCDCSTGIHKKAGERLFWLAGVMKYFGADKGLFVRKQLSGEKNIQLAKSLNIILLSEKQLYQLQKSYKVDSLEMVASFSDGSIVADKIFTLLKKFEPKVANYLLTGYWRDFPWSQISTTIATSTRVKDSLQLEERPKLFLTVYILSLLSLAVLRFSRQILTIPDEMKNDAIEFGLQGGKDIAREKMELIKSFHAVLSKEISERCKQNFPISESEFIDMFTPDYRKNLKDLVIRICTFPRIAIMAPRFFDALAYDVFLTNKNIDLNSILLNKKIDATTLLKPTIDVLTFADRSGIISGKFRDEFEKIISSLIR